MPKKVWEGNSSNMIIRQQSELKLSKVGLEEIEKYKKCQNPYQILYLDTYPEKVVKNS